MSSPSISMMPATRDIRSATMPFKRHRDATEKWANGGRPSAGVVLSITNDTFSGSDSQKAKVRPEKRWSEYGSPSKNHHNINKPASNSGDILRKTNHYMTHQRSGDDAWDTASSPLSRSLLDLIPVHMNNISGAVNMMGSSPADVAISPDVGVFYSFDRREAPGKPVELGDLVERAERRWEEERIEKVVRGEWEVLDGEGERVRLGGKSGKRHNIHSRKAIGSSDKDKTTPGLLVDDDFELV